MTKYTYSITVNFSGGISATCLDSEILNSTIPNILDGINIKGDVVEVDFDTALSVSDKTLLDTLVLNHNPNCQVGQNDNNEDTIPGSAPSTSGANFEVCFNNSHMNDKKGFYSVSKLKEKFTFSIPNNFVTLVSLEMVYIPKKDLVSGDTIDLRSNYAQQGEHFSNHSETVNNLPILGTKDIISSFDISPVFSSISAGDVCGVKIKEDTSGELYVLCIRLRYN